MTDEIDRIENCRVAMKAALEAIQDYCGTGNQESGAPTISFPGGLDVPTDYVPDDIIRIIDESATTSIAIEKLINHDWVKNQALSSGHSALPEDAPEALGRYYLEYARKKIAETLEWSRNAGTLQTAKERAGR